MEPQPDPHAPRPRRASVSIDSPRGRHSRVPTKLPSSVVSDLASLRDGTGDMGEDGDGGVDASRIIIRIPNKPPGEEAFLDGDPVSAAAEIGRPSSSSPRFGTTKGPRFVPIQCRWCHGTGRVLPVAVSDRGVTRVGAFEPRVPCPDCALAPLATIDSPFGRPRSATATSECGGGLKRTMSSGALAFTPSRMRMQCRCTPIHAHRCVPMHSVAAPDDGAIAVCLECKGVLVLPPHAFDALDADDSTPASVSHSAGSTRTPTPEVE